MKVHSERMANIGSTRLRPVPPPTEVAPTRVAAQEEEVPAPPSLAERLARKAGAR